MNGNGSVSRVELKRIASKRNLFILISVLMICAYFILGGIWEYKLTLSKAKEFQESESYVINNYRNYHEFSKNGFHILFIPSPASIFFSTVDNSNLTARVNGVAMLEINQSRVDNKTSNGASPINLNFSSVFLVILSIISLYEGISILQERNYLCMISSLTNRKPESMVLPIILFRFTFICTAFLIITGAMLGLVVFNGIELHLSDITSLLAFAGVACIVILIFLYMGTLISKINRRNKRHAFFWFFWLCILAGLPLIVSTVEKEMKVDITSPFKTYKDKLININRFEIRIEKKYGPFQRDNIEREQRIVKDFMKNELCQNEAMEKRIGEQMAENADTYNSISISNPVSFYFQTTSAAGSCSEDNLIKFYKYAHTIKHKFFEFIIERTYYNDPKIMVPFIKGDENLFYAKSHLPPNFGWGLLFNLFLVLVLAVITHFVYRNGPKHVKNNTIPRINPNTELSNLRCDRFGAVYVTNNRIRDFLFKLFCGKMPETVRPTDWSIKIDDVDIFSKELQGDFFYICRPGDIPGDIKVKTFLSFFASQGNLSASERSAVMDSSVIKPLLNKSFDQLKESERFEVMLSLTGLVKRKMYLVDDIMGELDRRYALRLFDRMKTISENGSYVLYLTSKIEAPPKMESFSDDVDFATGKPWYYDMTSRWLVSKQKD